MMSLRRLSSFLDRSALTLLPFVLLFASSLLLQGCGGSGSDTSTSSTPDGKTSWPHQAPGTVIHNKYIPPPGQEGAADCFVDRVWPWTDVQVRRDIGYGSAVNPFTGLDQDLLLDIYLPPESDRRAKRPLVVLIHGGAFVEGDKTSDYMPDTAKNYAIRGYVAISINYRLADQEEIAENSQSVLPVQVAQEDARAAVRYARAHAEELRLDPDRVLIGGHSAGAITALMYAYWWNATEGDSGTPGVSSAVQGVVSVSGELKYQAFCSGITKDNLDPTGCFLSPDPSIDFTDEVTEGDAPLTMFHGPLDMIVPYKNGKSVYKRAKQVGVDADFFTIPGADHRGAMVRLLDMEEPYIKQLMVRSSEVLRLKGVECPSNTNAHTIAV